jgi:hypothetical protein
MSLIEALNMKLEPIRSVLKNDVNEITVCQDMNRPTDVFYTLVSVYAPSVRKKVAEKIGAEGLFASNSDFIGSFSRGDAYCLVFLYRNENRLSTHEDLYSKNFAHEKQMAENLLVVCAETQVCASVGMLLLHERNVNVERDRSSISTIFWISGTGIPMRTTPSSTTRSAKKSLRCWRGSLSRNSART